MMVNRNKDGKIFTRWYSENYIKMLPDLFDEICHVIEFTEGNEDLKEELQIIIKTTERSKEDLR